MATKKTTTYKLIFPFQREDCSLKKQFSRLQFIEKDTMREEEKIITFCVCFSNMFLIDPLVFWHYLENKMILGRLYFFPQQYSNKKKENSIIKNSRKTRNKIKTSAQLILPIVFYLVWPF